MAPVEMTELRMAPIRDHRVGGVSGDRFGRNDRVVGEVGEEVRLQNAKDTFYEVVRDRLAGVNPERTVVVRGVTRPAVLVEENELGQASHGVKTADCFRLRWGKVLVDAAGALPMAVLQCEIRYETAGSAANAGMDRGRALAAMDAELMRLLVSQPRNAVKKDFSALANGGAAVVMATNVWWGEASWGEVKSAGERLMRAVAVPVMSFEEAGEM